MNTINNLTDQEMLRSKNTLNLIASENYPSQKTLALLGSVWSNKYGEGYPGKRYYAGNLYTDELETEVRNLALKVFQAEEKYGVNVQVLSGSPANSMVFLSVLEYGDTVLSLGLSDGGHLSHMHATSNWNKFFKLVNYNVKLKEKDTYEINIDDYKAKILEHQPKLVIIGFSAYPQQYQFAELITWAHLHGCLVLADIAHINGLVAAGMHDSPFLGDDISTADFVSMTTHKTFRGPRGAMLFAKNHIPDYITDDNIKKSKSLIDIIDKTVFPGTSGGPHFNVMAAIGQACIEILDGDTFKTYISNVLINTKACEDGLIAQGITIISPTQTHLLLIKLPISTDSYQLQLHLELLGIITNRNMIPNDPKTPYRPSGLRLGLAALTSRDISKEDSYLLGQLIGKIINNSINPAEAEREVLRILGNLTWEY
jgi:glycine hydroxymethyltransferase